jgi:hypothetical protein
MFDNLAKYHPGVENLSPEARADLEQMVAEREKDERRAEKAAKRSRFSRTR